MHDHDLVKLVIGGWIAQASQRCAAKGNIGESILELIAQVTQAIQRVHIQLNTALIKVVEQPDDLLTPAVDQQLMGPLQRKVEREDIVGIGDTAHDQLPFLVQGVIAQDHFFHRIEHNAVEIRGGNQGQPVKIEQQESVSLVALRQVSPGDIGTMGEVAGDVRFARTARANHNAALAQGYPAQDLSDGGGAVAGGEGGPFGDGLGRIRVND